MAANARGWGWVKTFGANNKTSVDRLTWCQTPLRSALSLQLFTWYEKRITLGVQFNPFLREVHWLRPGYLCEVLSNAVARSKRKREVVIMRSATDNSNDL